MRWTELADATDSHSELETRVWSAAKLLWVNASLKRSKFSPIVLGLIFLRYADIRFSAIKCGIRSAAGFHQNSKKPGQRLANRRPDLAVI